MTAVSDGYARAQAIEFARAAAELNLRWFEEPCRCLNDRFSMRDVRLATGMLVTAGQSESTRAGQRHLIASGAVNFCNADASWIGGPSE